VSAAPEQLSTPSVEPEEAIVHKNTVRQIVEEICNLMGDTHHIREEILARGVQFHTLNILIEMGVHNKPDEQAEVMKTALAASYKAHGSAAITAEQLRNHLQNLVSLERDIGHVRRLAKQQKINMQALNFLTQFIRLNPGDGGERVINEFVAYALLCDIKLEKFKDIADTIGGDRKSVLPQIENDTEDEQLRARKKILVDVAIGLAIGVSALWLFQ